MTTIAARTRASGLTTVSIVGVKIKFSPLQLQGLRRIIRNGEPEVFSIKAENLGVGDYICIHGDEEDKVQHALDKGTGVKLTIDPDIQTKPILDWIKSTLHKKSAVRTSRKKDVVQKIVEVIEPEEEEQAGNGGYLPYQPRGRGFMMRRLNNAPSLERWRNMQSRRAGVSPTQASGKGVGKTVRKVTRATHRGVVRASNKLQSIINRLRKN